MLPEIQSFCSIKNGEVQLNGGVVFVDKENKLAEDFFTAIYRNIKLQYPKFFKMDLLCKLALLSTELIVKDSNISATNSEDVGLIFSNKSSSMQTDETYYQAIADKNNYFPSPSVFVYTLPNILVGEICIRNNFTGENSFFVAEKFNAELLADYVNYLFKFNLAKTIIGGWVEINENKEYDAFAFLVSQQKGLQPFTSVMLEALYRNS